MSSLGESVNVSELDALMKEFPDWKEQFPDIYKELNPPRYHKSRQDPSTIPSESVPDANDFYARFVKKNKRGESFPKTDYQATYRKHKLRPRSTKRPPPERWDPNLQPMTFDTSQRSAYVPKDLGCRSEPMKKVETYQPTTTEPFDAKSSYQREYQNFSLPEITRPTQTDFQKSHLLNANSAKFEDRTTTKDHYRHWVPQPVCAFRDLPSFTDSLLYPTKSRHLETTTKSTFKGTAGRRSTPSKMAEGTLKPEGKTDMDTVNRLTYQRFEGARPAKKCHPKPEMIGLKKSTFQGVTQSMSDFPGFKRDGMPLPPAPVEPPQATIDLANDNTTYFETEQRREFQGIDTSQHPVEKVGKRSEEYKSPTVKFETMTNQKLDYRPIDISEAYCPRVQAPVARYKQSTAKLDDVTMNKQFFKKYDVKPRERHGDFHENHSYVPPLERFQGTTTTRETFRKPRGAEVPVSFKPEAKPIDAEGSHDFKTVYGTCFTQPSVARQLSLKQQMQLYKELRRRKKELGRVAGNSRTIAAH